MLDLSVIDYKDIYGTDESAALQKDRYERAISEFTKTFEDMMLHGKDMRDQSGMDYIAVPTAFLEIITEELSDEAEKLIVKLRKG